LDAEHFKQKYQAAVTKLIDVGASEFLSLGDCLSSLTNGHTPLRHDLNSGEVSFLTAEHVNDFRIDFNSQKRILEMHHSGELSRTALKNGDVLMTIKGRVGNAALVEKLTFDANINQDVALLRFKKNAPSIWYLLAFINSKFGKLEVEKWSTGQINPFLGLGNLVKIRIPIFSSEIMSDIGEKARLSIQAAVAEKATAKKLLEAATCAVEIAIEQNEAAALRFLEEAGA
jgi:hypothetical protein